MLYILNIHTATETAIVNLSRDDETLCTKINTQTKEHAAFLHPAINEMLKDEGVSIQQIEGIGITLGPGSYTGMRVGLAAAKGLCYSLSIPLVTFNTLEVMAASCVQAIRDKDALYCPMIDARRMEVYTALYSYDIDQIEAPVAKILSKNSYTHHLEKGKIFFFGSGSAKFQILSEFPDSCFSRIEISSGILTQFAWDKMRKKDFENAACTQPLYIKEFYTK